MMEFPMYQRIKLLCKPENRAFGPAVDTETFLSNPVLQEECIDCLTMLHQEKFSCYISGLMDHLGYSFSMIKERQHCFHTMTYGEGDEFLTYITSGSKGEGIALLYENDLDIMYVPHDVTCADNPQQFMHEQNMTLFQMERGPETSPGYTRLRLVKNNGSFSRNDIRKSLIASETGSAYLSNQSINALFRNRLEENMPIMFKLRDQQGPSSPISILSLDKDCVWSFKCYCPDLLNSWLSRPRNHGWPSSDLLYEVSLLDGHVVPVGCKGSENMYREWRICYTLAELHLIRNFNEIQLKVYILLKKICKSVLNLVCEEMTSYIMKNIVFWICEEKGLRMFTQCHLIDRLLDCIQYLRTCIIKGNLPNYMIPERNLLSGRLDIEQRHRLVDLLGNLLHEGGRMLLWCDRMREAMLVMYREPDMFREFCEKRHKIESHCLILISTKVTNQGMGLLQEIFYILKHTNILQSIHFDVQLLTEMTVEELCYLFGTPMKQILS